MNFIVVVVYKHVTSHGKVMESVLGESWTVISTSVIWLFRSIFLMYCEVCFFTCKVQ